jgi:hypothetical protein
VSQGTWDFAIDPAAGFETLKVSAVAYNNGAPTAAGEGTDFSVAQITYTPLDAPLV